MRAKSLRLGLVAVMMMAFAACRHERQSITGAYGNSVISGVVAMASGGSPAGVEVSVPGTGMKTVVGEDGRFAFFDVPDGTELHFRREADRIDASLRTEKGASHVTVELSPANAAAVSGSGSRRRAAGSSTETTKTYRGTVRSTSPTRLVIGTADGEVAFELNASTKVTKGDQPATIADLAPGQDVYVGALVAADGTKTAVRIEILRATEPPPPTTKTYRGTVRTASSTRLVIGTADGEVAFVLNASTKVTKGDQPATIADLAPGQDVYVGALVAADGTKTAVRIEILRPTEPPPPTTKTYEGTVKSVSTDRLVLATKDGDVAFVLNASTKVTKGDQPMTIADLKAGQRVYVGANVAADGTKTAFRVAILSAG